MPLPCTDCRFIGWELGGEPVPPPAIVNLNRAENKDRRPYCIRLKLFSIWCWVSSTMMGRPWGQV